MAAAPGGGRVPSRGLIRNSGCFFQRPSLSRRRYAWRLTLSLFPGEESGRKYARGCVLTYARVLMNTRVGVGPLDDVLDGAKQTLWTLRAWRGQAYQVHRTSLRHRRDPRPTAELTTLRVTSRSSSSMAWMTTPGDVSAASVNGPLCGKTLNILSAIWFRRFSKRQSHSNIFLERPGWLSQKTPPHTLSATLWARGRTRPGLLGSLAAFLLASLLDRAAIGLSRARRAGVKLPPRGPLRTSAEARRRAELDTEKAEQKTKPSGRRPQAIKAALKRDGKAVVSRKALSRHARSISSLRIHPPPSKVPFPVRRLPLNIDVMARCRFHERANTLSLIRISRRDWRRNSRNRSCPRWMARFKRRTFL